SNNTAIITLDIFYYDTGARQVNAFPHKNIRKYEGRDWFLTYYFTGAAHLMKSELFEKTGLYPEDFFYGMEEYDLSYRVIDAGYSLAYDNSVKVLHKESPLGRLPHREKLTMMWLNKARVVWTYLPIRYFFSSFFLWSLFYLKSSKWDFSGCVKNYFKGFKVFSFPRRPLRRAGLLYLKKVEARLWY